MEIDMLNSKFWANYFKVYGNLIYSKPKQKTAYFLAF